jgi:hypothetical protein
MKKLALFKAAFDFSFANVGENDAVKLAQASLDAFKAAGGDQADFAVWNGAVTQYRQNLSAIKGQKLPSEQVAAIVPKPLSTAAPAA